MKTHLSFSTTNLAKSLEFYSTLLDARPAKALDDYALFITEAPGLDLSLDVTQKVSPAKDAHYGLCVESVEDVERAIARLEGAGLVASIERQQTCCYANQTKVWAIDPDGRRWEVYTVHEETNEHDSTECCDKETVCCAC
ncbi:MAG TPA: ArsI/CadI family heavy metal resistance metalloenzyme [Candidatus Cybelea sp.]|jgi:catechol 2,3-dioxygenase-like lactoylglutathione lyase family enzyme|nr:ArsI/CadI family heavy metal resistance metalloenzyme [Candidatus Cybelea sp.]